MQNAGYFMNGVANSICLYYYCFKSNRECKSMKKTLLIMIAVLLIFSFTSCKDSSEEIIQTFEDYKKIQSFIVYADDVISNSEIKREGDEVNYSVKKDDISDYYLVDLLEGIGYDYTSVTVTGASGTVVATNSATKLDHNFKDIVITYTVGEDAAEKTFTMSGTFKEEITGSEENPVKSFAYSFKINGTDYSLSYSFNSKYEVTAAKVNGKDVNLRLVNSDIHRYA